MQFSLFTTCESISVFICTRKCVIRHLKHMLTLILIDVGHKTGFTLLLWPLTNWNMPVMYFHCRPLRLPLQDADSVLTEAIHPRLPHQVTQWKFSSPLNLIGIWYLLTRFRLDLRSGQLSLPCFEPTWAIPQICWEVKSAQSQPQPGHHSRKEGTLHSTTS